MGRPALSGHDAGFLPVRQWQLDLALHEQLPEQEGRGQCVRGRMTGSGEKLRPE